MPSLLFSGLLLWASLATTPAKEGTPASNEATKPSAQESSKSSVFEEDVPPVTEFDRLQKTEIPSEPRRDLLSQVARTIFALVVVLGLIFLFSKYGLSRLTGLRTGVGGKNIQVLERVQLDPKHTLYLVDVQGIGSLLLGGGEGDLRLITKLNSNTPPSPDTPFSVTLAQTKSTDSNFPPGKGSSS